MSFKTRSLKLATPEHHARVTAVNPPLQQKLKALEGSRKRATDELRLVTLRQHYPQQTETDRKETLRALKIADNNRTLPERILVEKLQFAEAISDADQPAPVVEAREAVRDLERKIVELRRTMVPPVKVRALWDRGEPSPTYILLRGEHDKPGRLVGPGVPSVLTDGKTPFEIKPPFPNGTRKTGRRLAFARWLTRPDHPLTARVMVNRIWYHHFGSGLVKSLENFGVKGTKPTHPELLDWLAIRFVDEGWSLKSMHRLIMNSGTYRQSSQIQQDQAELDSQNRWLSRMPLRRMNAEALRDSLLFVAGKLDETPGGPPDPVIVGRNGAVSVYPTASGGWRRSVYLQYRRTEIPTLMDTFDYPEMGPNCVSRSVSTVSPQSLMLMNNEHIRQLAASMAERIAAVIAESRETQWEESVEQVYQLALSRKPDVEELRLGVETLRELHTAWQGNTQKTLETYCHTILNSAAFIYID